MFTVIFVIYDNLFHMVV